MFRNAFSQRLRRFKKDIKLPPFDLVEPDDYYVYYVLLMEMPETLFWDADLSLLSAVADTKGAYSEWLAGEQCRVSRERR